MKFLKQLALTRRRAGLGRAVTGGVIVRVLLTGFGLVIVLLLVAGLLGIRNIASIRLTTKDLLEDQVRVYDLLDAVLREQRTIDKIYSTIARRPENVDRDVVLSQLEASDKDLEQIVEAASDEPEQGLWKQLFDEATGFSQEARKVLATEGPLAGPSPRLLESHKTVLALVDRLVEVESKRQKGLRAQMEALSGNQMLQSSALLGASLVLALVSAFITVRLAGSLVRQMEWQTGELSRVSWQLLEKQETTARRFSHELHDELGQSLSALRANLTPLTAHEAARAEAQDCIALVDEAIRNVRELSQLLRPTILDDFGLAASLRWLCERFALRAGVEVQFNSKFDGRMADETETHLFRIAQEALTNVARHSGATRVTIDLDRSPSGIQLSIRDNGRGVADAESNSERPRGLGIVGMRARARSAGGELVIASHPGNGTLIEASFPYRAREEA